jgi:hypothetical protein
MALKCRASRKFREARLSGLRATPMGDGPRAPTTEWIKGIVAQRWKQMTVSTPSSNLGPHLFGVGWLLR